MIIEGAYRHRSGTDTARQAAIVHEREIHVTSDRRELWIGSELIGGKGYDAIAPDPAGGGYALSTTLDWPVRYRNHVGRVAPVLWIDGGYTHTVILPNEALVPARNGDEGTIFAVLPATIEGERISLRYRNGSLLGTLLVELASEDAEAKWKLCFAVTGGAWELFSATKLELE